ncbi:MAG: hypothetical protein CM15mP75_3780 [Flammeovirgaceae bacterium]|nr:MAG: hypothetical protein CM15mP75_3780 [Flammeovirgaceae bacterium]
MKNIKIVKLYDLNLSDFILINFMISLKVSN